MKAVLIVALNLLCVQNNKVASRFATMKNAIETHNLLCSRSCYKWKGDTYIKHKFSIIEFLKVSNKIIITSPYLIVIKKKIGKNGNGKKIFVVLILLKLLYIHTFGTMYPLSWWYGHCTSTAFLSPTVSDISKCKGSMFNSASFVGRNVLIAFSLCYYPCVVIFVCTVSYSFFCYS